jgi:hypothetical protein
LSKTKISSTKARLAEESELTLSEDGDTDDKLVDPRLRVFVPVKPDPVVPGEPDDEEMDDNEAMEDVVKDQFDEEECNEEEEPNGDIITEAMRTNEVELKCVEAPSAWWKEGGGQFHTCGGSIGQSVLALSTQLSTAQMELTSPAKYSGRK